MCYKTLLRRVFIPGLAFFVRILSHDPSPGNRPGLFGRNRTGEKVAFLTIIPEFLLRWKNRPETGKIDFSPVPIFFGSRSCRCRRRRRHRRCRRRPKKRERNSFSRFLVNKQKIGFLLFRSKFGQQKNMLGRGSQERGTSLSLSLSLTLSFRHTHPHSRSLPFPLFRVQALSLETPLSSLFKVTKAVIIVIVVIFLWHSSSNRLRFPTNVF